MNPTFIDKNDKNIKGKKWHIVKFIEVYLLKWQNWLQQNYYVHKKNKIIVTCSVKQRVGQIKQTIWKQQCGTCIQIWGFAISLTMFEAKILMHSFKFLGLCY